MEIKKEDFVRFRIVDTFFYALPMSYFKEEKEVIYTTEGVMDKAEFEAKKEEALITAKKIEKEEVDAIAKAKEIEELKAKLEALEE